MRSNVTLKNGRIVAHRPFDNGATEAFMQDGGNMSNEEWLEYVSLTTPTSKRKPTWNEIKDSKNIIIGIDYAKEDKL